MVTDIEEWKPCVGYDGYLVSSHGRVKSMKSGEPYEMLSHPNHKGYRMVCVRSGGKSFRRRIHRLVLDAFVGECPDGMQCSHIDGDPANNRLDNLNWVSQMENHLQKELHGTSNTKLTENDVKAIRRRFSDGETVYRISKDYPVSNKTIYGVVHRHHWKHID
jgi:hypothetical protein